MNEEVECDCLSCQAVEESAQSLPILATNPPIKATVIQAMSLHILAANPPNTGNNYRQSFCQFSPQIPPIQATVTGNVFNYSKLGITCMAATRTALTVENGVSNARDVMTL
jgi:hypothetical protein